MAVGERCCSWLNRVRSIPTDADAFGWTRAADPAPLTAIQDRDPRYYYGRLSARSSASGIGSDVGSNLTASHLRFISRQIERLRIRTMIDAPCGDVNWQMGSWAIDSLAAYVGLDIVQRVVDLDRLRFGHHSNKQFGRWDLAACPLPQIVWAHDSTSGSGLPGTSQPADLVLMRHVLQHMPLERATMALRHAVKSGASYLIATTFLPAGTGGARRGGHNSHVPEGGWFSNNLMAAPFLLHSPEECVHDSVHDSVNDGRDGSSHSSGKGPTRAAAICLWVFDEAQRRMWLQNQSHP